MLNRKTKYTTAVLNGETEDLDANSKIPATSLQKIGKKESPENRSKKEMSPEKHREKEDSPEKCSEKEESTEKRSKNDRTASKSQAQAKKKSKESPVEKRKKGPKSSKAQAFETTSCISSKDADEQAALTTQIGILEAQIEATDDPEVKAAFGKALELITAKAAAQQAPAAGMTLSSQQVYDKAKSLIAKIDRQREIMAEAHAKLEEHERALQEVMLLGLPDEEVPARTPEAPEEEASNT